MWWKNGQRESGKAGSSSGLPSPPDPNLIPATPSVASVAPVQNPPSSVPPCLCGKFPPSFVYFAVKHSGPHPCHPWFKASSCLGSFASVERIFSSGKASANSVILNRFCWENPRPNSATNFPDRVGKISRPHSARCSCRMSWRIRGLIIAPLTTQISRTILLESVALAVGFILPEPNTRDREG